MARTMTSETEKNIRGGACTPYDGRKALQAELDKEREVSRKLADALQSTLNMIGARHWADKEFCEAVLALYREAK